MSLSYLNLLLFLKVQPRLSELTHLGDAYSIGSVTDLLLLKDEQDF